MGCSGEGSVEVRRAAQVGRAAYRSARGRNHAHLPRLGAELWPVAQRVSVLVLPEMHHLVEERVRHVLPTVLFHVPTAHRDLEGLARLPAEAELSKAAPHPARESDR